MVDHVINPMVAHTVALDVFAQMQRHSTIGKRLADEGRAGFFFVLGRFRVLPRGLNPREIESRELIGTLIGAEPERLEKYQTLAREKLARLYDWNAAHSHRTSRQSRDVEEDKYAGAVLGMRYGVSASGLPEDDDEIFSSAVLYRIGDLAWEWAVEFLAHNSSFYPDDREMQRIFQGGTR